MRKLTEEQVSQLQHIKEWVTVILNFIGKMTPPNTPTYHIQFLEIVEQTYNSHDLRGMKMLLKDVTEWSKGLSPLQFEELNTLLKQKFGKVTFNS